MYPQKPEQDPDARHGRFGLPWDMKIVLLWTALCIISIYTPLLNESFLRFILALPLILFIPGYVLLAALFPDSANIDTIERVVLSIGTSIVITPLIGLCLNFTSWGIRLDPILFSLTGFIIALVIIAGIRRFHTPEGLQYTLPVPEITQAVHNKWASRNRSKRDRILFFTGIFAIALLVFSVVLVVTLPKPGEKFSEFYILGANRTADSYPMNIISEIPYPMYVGISNHEFRTVNYSVEIYLESISENEEINKLTQPEMLLVGTYSVTLNYNETSIIPFDLIVPDANYNRVNFLLFDGTPPGSEVTGLNRVNASYRDLHLWLNRPLPVKQFLLLEQNQTSESFPEVIPHDNEVLPTTQFLLLGQNQTSESFPEVITPDSSRLMYVGIGNHEFRTVNYSVEIYLEPKPANNMINASTQPEMLLVGTYSVTLNHNKTSIIPFDLIVPDTRYNGMNFLLFKERSPDSDITGLNRVNASYQNLHLRFNVTSPITQFYILEQNETAPTLQFFIQNQTSESFPEARLINDPPFMYIVIENHEVRMVNYSVEVYLKPKSMNRDDSTIIPSREIPLKNYTVVLNHNEISEMPLKIRFPNPGSYQIDFLLFNENGVKQKLSGIDRLDASYRNCHLWFNVTPLINTTTIR